MTATPHPAAGADRLWYARAALADDAADDAALRLACALIAEIAPCATERARARDLAHLIEGETTCTGP